jgi:hypothetical protein
MEHNPIYSPSVTPVPTPAALDPLKPLRLLVHASAISIIILTGTLFVFIYRQVITLRKSTAELVNYIVEYQQSNASDFIAEAHNRFAEFRKENPDFNPIYSKYFGTNPPPARKVMTNEPSKVVPIQPR